MIPKTFLRKLISPFCPQPHVNTHPVLGDRQTSAQKPLRLSPVATGRGGKLLDGTSKERNLFRYFQASPFQLSENFNHSMTVL